MNNYESISSLVYNTSSGLTDLLEIMDVRAPVIPPPAMLLMYSVLLGDQWFVDDGRVVLCLSISELCITLRIP